MNPIEKLKERVETFKKYQRMFSKFGAEDTEPDWEFENAIRDAYQGKEAHVPSSAYEWQLYDGMDGVDAAAIDLTNIAKQAVEALQKIPMGLKADLRKYLDSWVWRADLDYAG